MMGFLFKAHSISSLASFYRMISAWLPADTCFDQIPLLGVSTRAQDDSRSPEEDVTRARPGQSRTHGGCFSVSPARDTKQATCDCETLSLSSVVIWTVEADDHTSGQ